jgi:hypothetical protein
MRNADVNLRRVERIGFHHSDTITQNMEARRAGERKSLQCNRSPAPLGEATSTQPLTVSHPFRVSVTPADLTKGLLA